MNKSNARKLMTHGAMSAAILAAAWGLGVSPLQESLQQERASRAVDADRIASYAQLDGQSLAQPARLVGRLIRNAKAINESCAISGSDAHLYEELGRLAERTGVRIERMEPHRAHNTTVPSNDGLDRLPVRSSGYTINFEGSFSQVVAFVDAVENETGLCRLSACRLVQGGVLDGSSQILATITTEHFALATPLAVVPANSSDSGGTP